MDAIGTQQEADALMSSVDWEHAFIRELVVKSPSYIKDDGSVVAPDALPDVELVVATPSAESAAVRLRLEEAEELALPFRVDADIRVHVNRSDFEVRLSTGRVIARCARIYVARIERYGREYVLAGPGEGESE